MQNPNTVIQLCRVTVLHTTCYIFSDPVVYSFADAVHRMWTPSEITLDGEITAVFAAAIVCLVHTFPTLHHSPLVMSDSLGYSELT